MGLEVRAVVPGERGDAVAGADAEVRERAGEAPRANGPVGVGVAMQRLVRPARHDFAAAEQLFGATEDRREREREVHHQAVHRVLQGRDSVRDERIVVGNAGPGERMGTRYPLGRSFP